MSRQPQIRYRIWFGKTGPLQYTSHLDLARTWERTLRRAQAHLIYSQGYNPRPRIQLAAALPLGYVSTCEIIDIWLMANHTTQPEELLHRLRKSAPLGLMVTRIEQIPLSSPALPATVRTATYEVRIKERISASEVARRVEALLGKVSHLQERRGKVYDLRPLIQHLSVADTEGLTLRMTLTTSQDAGTGRPDTVVAALGLSPHQAHVVRTSLNLEQDNATEE